MLFQDHLDKVWLIYYASGLVFLAGIVLASFRWRFAFINVWLPFIFCVFVFVPLPVGQESDQVAPMIGVWLMSLFSG